MPSEFEPINRPVILSGLIGIVVTTGLIVLSSGFTTTSAGRLVVMAALVLLAAKGKRWAAWLISAWFIILGVVIAVNLLQGTSVWGVAIGVGLALLLVGSGVQILRVWNRSAGVNGPSSELI